MDKQLLKIKAEAAIANEIPLCIQGGVILELLAENEQLRKAIEDYLEWSSGKGPKDSIETYKNLVKVLNETSTR